MLHSIDIKKINSSLIQIVLAETEHFPVCGFHSLNLFSGLAQDGKIEEQVVSRQTQISTSRPQWKCFHALFIYFSNLPFIYILEQTGWCVCCCKNSFVWRNSGCWEKNKRLTSLLCMHTLPKLYVLIKCWVKPRSLPKSI